MSRWILPLLLLIGSCAACSNQAVRYVPLVVVDTVFVDTAATREWGRGPSRVVIPDEIVDSLSVLWIENERVEGPEFVTCLSADKFSYVVFHGGFPAEVQGWRVTGFEVAQINATRTSADEADCAGKGFQGRLHSHPILTFKRGPNKGKPALTCQRSDVDRYSFWKYRNNFEVVFCGPRDFRWYTRNGEQGGSGIGKIIWSAPFERNY